MNIRNLVIIVLSSISLVACKSKAIYSEYQSIPSEGWNEDSVLCFDVPVPDTTDVYDVILHVRHTDQYPYQNMWWFVTENGRVDTIEFYLADEHGKWLGNGHSTIDMPVLYRENMRFSDSTYSLRIQHGMREHSLLGVSEVGVEVMHK